MLYFKSVANLMHDVSNHLTPSNISSLFIASEQIHNYKTRFSSKGNYYVKFSRLNKQKDSLSRIGTKIWNSIPLYLRKLPKLSFKKTLHAKLLQILSDEDDYVDLSTLITKIAQS